MLLLPALVLERPFMRRSCNQCYFLEFGKRCGVNLSSEMACDLVEISGVLLGDKRDCISFCASSCRASDAVDVIVRCFGHFIIVDM